MLEDIVNKQSGKLRLAKLDVDTNQKLAAQLRVQSLPTVYGIADGKVVDQFIGLPQEQVLHEFVDNLLSQGSGNDEGGANSTP